MVWLTGLLVDWMWGIYKSKGNQGLCTVLAEQMQADRDLTIEGADLAETGRLTPEV